MKALRFLITTTLLVGASTLSFAQEIWSIGPMLHFNFGGEKPRTTFSIETAYWNIDAFPYSVDFAVEFGRNKVFIYSEVQTGIGITGVSFGPVVQLSSKYGSHIGVQGSCWANYILGFDYRIRFIDHQKLNYIGSYIKVPFATSGFDDDGNNSSSWGDWDD